MADVRGNAGSPGYGPFCTSPNERVQGEVQRIFLFPSAVSLDGISRLLYCGRGRVQPSYGREKRSADLLAQGCRRTRYGVSVRSSLLTGPPLGASRSGACGGPGTPVLTMTLVLWLIYAAYVPAAGFLPEITRTVARYAAVPGHCWRD